MCEKLLSESEPPAQLATNVHSHLPYYPPGTGQEVRPQATCHGLSAVLLIMLFPPELTGPRTAHCKDVISPGVYQVQVCGQETLTD